MNKHKQETKLSAARRAELRRRVQLAKHRLSRGALSQSEWEATMRALEHAERELKAKR